MADIYYDESTGTTYARMWDKYGRQFYTQIKPCEEDKPYATRWTGQRLAAAKLKWNRALYYQKQKARRCFTLQKQLKEAQNEYRQFKCNAEAAKQEYHSILDNLNYVKKTINKIRAKEQSEEDSIDS